MNLSRQQINAISNSIVEMKSEISQLEIEQVTLLTRYEQAFDLASVKESAQSAGMSQPSDSQIYYIDLPGQDRAVAYTTEKMVLLEYGIAKMEVKSLKNILKMERGTE